MAAIFILLEWLFWWLLRKNIFGLAENCSGQLPTEALTA
jgi:hypothetical protein